MADDNVLRVVFSQEKPRDITNTMNTENETPEHGGGDGGGSDLGERVARIESDVEHIKTTLVDIKGGIKDLRTEMTGDIKDLRTEMTGDIKDLRTEMTGDIKDLRTEMKDMRQDMNNGFNKIIMFNTTIVLASMAFIGAVIAYIR